jgi:cell division protein FtsI/penicillin-binding protein 2
MFVLIGVRLFQIQVLQKGYYQAVAQEEHLRRWELKADRGNIFIKDRDGVVPLAINSSVYNLSASPKDIDEDFGEVSNRLSKIIGVDESTLKDDLESSKNKSYLPIAKRLTSAQAREVMGNSYQDSRSAPDVLTDLCLTGIGRS